MSSRHLVWAVLLLLTFISATAFATEPVEANQKNYELRTEFIESRLEEDRRHAEYWQYGWSTFYAVSAVAQTALWIDADNNDDRVNYSIGAVKSVGGLVDILLRPHPGRHGATPLLDLPQETAEQKHARLERSETLLRASAERAASRYTWKPHIKIVGVNLIAGALIAAFGDEGDALTSTAIGIAIGEANIWTQPTRTETDWREYQQQFPTTGATQTSGWHLVPIKRGLALQTHF